MKKIRGISVVTLTQNFVWATLCVALALIINSLLLENSRLQQQTQNLTQKIALSKQQPCIARDAWQAGTSQTFSVESDGLKRDYIVHLPADFTPTKTYPALLYFSGKGTGAVAGDLYSSYNNLPVIAIYPEPVVGKDGLQAWQGAPYSASVNDVAFVGHILDRVQGQLCINRSHVYAVGVSNGGGMVALLSCHMPDRIRAFATIAGAFYPQSACTPKQSAPLIAIHGDQDFAVPYLGSAVRQLPHVDDWSTKRAVQNICKTQPFVSHQATTVTATWQGCANGATVQLVRLLGTGHAWTPAERDVIWQFFTSITQT